MSDTPGTRYAVVGLGSRCPHARHAARALFSPGQFDEVIRRQRVGRMVVTSIDSTHDEYITRAMRLGCDVLTEKPMTIDAQRCQQILDTVRSTGRRLTVTFNYRYAPRSSKVKELLAGLVRL